MNDVTAAMGDTQAAALALIEAPARADPQTAEAAAGTPLRLMPPIKRVKKPARTTEASKPQGIAQRRATPASWTVARQKDDAIMRGHDNVSLIAMLPWWRADRMQTIRYIDREVESPVLTAADVWFGRPIAEGHTAATGEPVQLVSADDLNEIDLAAETAAEMGAADPDEFNEIDAALAFAPAHEPQGSDKSWLQALLAVFGGAMAAVSTVRFLFV